MMRRVKLTIFLNVLFVCTTLLAALSLWGAKGSLASGMPSSDRVLRIYQDTDWSNNKESARAMEMGMKVALDEIGNEIQGYKIEFVKRDHRGNSVRSKMNMEEFLRDPHGLFVLGGLHSPPYIKYRDFINENGVLLVVPWAAGGPITRYDEGTNWVFRGSIDDTKAGYRLADYAVNTKGCKKPHLVLEETAWGRSNNRTITKALHEYLGYDPRLHWFGWSTKENGARAILRSIIQDGADCVLFVGAVPEGKIFAQVMLQFDEAERLPIISHWGITAGDFPEVITARMREYLDISFIQSCFSFVSSSPTPLSQEVFARAQKLFPEEIKEAADISAPVGFIHAYDLGRIVIEALHRMVITGDAAHDRAALRTSLESLFDPVEGLVKTYVQPFRPWTKDDPDAHETLGLDDLCMAEFGANNEIIVFPNN
jgi:branched-chain amino acid transport system substrate-binding protein